MINDTGKRYAGRKTFVMEAAQNKPSFNKKSLLRIYRLLYGAYGPCNWWPGDGPFEVMIGAILTQNTAWKNVEKAITNIKKKNSLEPENLHKMSQDKLAELIRPAGYFRQKAKKIKIFLDYFGGNYEYSIDEMKKRSLDKVRQELLGCWGIGPETADSILLYALDKPIFVVDNYTMRIFGRLGYFNSKDDYDSAQRFFMKYLAPDPGLYNEYHACLVALGNDVCNTKPKCTRCPLNGKIFCDPTRTV